MLNSLFIYVCSVNIWSTDATPMLFGSTIPLTVWRAPYCKFNVKLAVITVCLPVIVEFSGPMNHLKPVCAIDRLRLLNHYYHCYYFNLKSYVLRVPLLPCDIYNIILRRLNIFTYFIDICHKQMLMYGYIKFWRSSRNVWITSSVSIVYEQPS